MQLLLKKTSEKPTSFTPMRGDLLSAIKFILTTATGITPLTESSNIATMTMHFNVELSFLAHLSRRLTGELIVYTGIRRPSVRRPSTFSNDISSEAVRRILSILHI